VIPATKATIEEIQAAAAKGAKLFTLDAAAGVSATIICSLAISPPVGGGSPGSSVQVSAALQCSDWEDVVSLYVELWRDLAHATTTGAALPHAYGLFVTAVENTCRTGIYWGIATSYVRRAGYTPASVVLHVHSVPLPVGCGSAAPPLPPPPTGSVIVTNPGNQYAIKWDTVSLQIVAGGCQFGCTWSANGLPPGLNINPSTGLITGPASATGTYQVSVTAVAGIGKEGFTSFSWTVSPESCRYC
jgi:hypothetical protein